MLHEQTDRPNFNWIDGGLAVGGSFPASSIESLAREHRIRCVIDLRGEIQPEGELLERHGIALLHLPTEDTCGVDSVHLQRGVEWAVASLARGERVLIHCEHGIGRSATLALCVLVSRGRAPLGALALLKDKRPVVSPSPAQFACWCEWLENHRAANAVTWDVPGFDDFQRIAYRWH